MKEPPLAKTKKEWNRTAHERLMFQIEKEKGLKSYFRQIVGAYGDALPKVTIARMILGALKEVFNERTLKIAANKVIFNEEEDE